MSFYVVILAAGESTRMGSPKALLQIQGKTFLEHLVATLRNAGLHEISVVLGHDSDKIIAQLPDLKVDFVINENYQKGQLSSIQAAIKSVPKDCDAIMICPIDRPLISPELIKIILEEYSKTKSPIVIPIFDAKRGHPIIFSSSLFPELMRAPRDIGARAVVWAHHNEVKEVPTEEAGILINVDTPEMFEKHIKQMNIE